MTAKIVKAVRLPNHWNWKLSNETESKHRSATKVNTVKEKNVKSKSRPVLFNF